MKIYHGERAANGAMVRVSVNGVDCALPLKLNLRNHSTDGCEWGYGGSGPAQLALAICADALRDDARAVRVYQAFKWRVIAPLQANSWQMTEAEVLAHITACEAKEAKQSGDTSPELVFWIFMLVSIITLLAGIFFRARESDGVPSGATATIERSGAEGEIERNEAACKREARPGLIPYVVSRNGLLRGCLLVPENADPRDPPRGIRFVWKEPPL